MTCSAIKLGRESFQGSHGSDTAWARVCRWAVVIAFFIFFLQLLNCLFLDPQVFLAFALLILSPIPAVGGCKRGAGGCFVAGRGQSIPLCHQRKTNISCLSHSVALLEKLKLTLSHHFTLLAFCTHFMLCRALTKAGNIWKVKSWVSLLSASELPPAEKLFLTNQEL